MMKKRIRRRESREALERIDLSRELVKVIRRFFPDLVDLLKQVHDPRHQSYILYKNHVLLMTRILSAIFYISSMRKTSEEFNCQTIIENIGALCGEKLEEIPYWETINQYLARIGPEELQDKVCKTVKRLIRSRAFEDSRIRNKYWQIIVDGTQLVSSRKELDGAYVYKVHNKGTEKEYTEYCYYVLEAKIVLHNEIVVSIMSEFVENTNIEAKKQDCERKACSRLMERLKRVFPRLPICICGDSLYACESFFRECKKYDWRYILRYKEGSIPSIFREYQDLQNLEGNRRDKTSSRGAFWYDFVNDIDYNGIKVNCLEYGESWEAYPLYFLTDLVLRHKNAEATAADGRRRWAIENHGFNAQKKHGFYIEHLFSKNCQAMKNHYFLIQIAHMISQIMDAWDIWGSFRLSKEQKHRRMLESWKLHRLRQSELLDPPLYQIRFI